MKMIFLGGRDALHTFAASLTGLSLLVPCLFWLCFCNQDRAKKNHLDPKMTRSIVILPILAVGMVLAPFACYIVQRMIGAQPLSDCFIMIPIGLIVAYTVIHLLEYLRLPAKKETGLLLALLFIMIASVSAPWRFSMDGYRLPWSAARTGGELRQIAEIAGDKEVILPEAVMGQVGEYYCDIHPVYIANDPADPYDETDCRDAIRASRRHGRALIVINKRWDNKKRYRAARYKEKARVGDYIIYEHAP